MDKLTRLAIVNEDKCKPKKCRQECKRSCPVVRMGKMCIEVSPKSTIASISEELCIGCGACVKACPFKAIKIVNLPTDIEKDTIHRYGQNRFKLHRLPIPRLNSVLGIVGSNGTGKSTILKILSGKLKPNLGGEASWEQILHHFRGSELHAYFTKMLAGSLTSALKIQYVDLIPKQVKGCVKDYHLPEEVINKFELTAILDRKIEDLSGGELQRFACAMTYTRNVDVYMFDEPSSYLDIRQRLKVAKCIRDLKEGKYVIVVEHDLSVLDYLSDFIHCLYGVPGAYGVVTMPFGVGDGINIFLDGMIPTENLRFRETALNFKMGLEIAEKRTFVREYPCLGKSYDGFKLKIMPGSFSDSEIIVMLGENGSGKTTFIRLLSGLLKSDGEAQVPEINVSYKPQKIAPKFDGTVRQLLLSKIHTFMTHPQFVSDVLKPLYIDDILDYDVKDLSGGELQRVAITIALGKPADVYLLDEPSAYLDSEQRVAAAKVIKRFILHNRKTAFVVEHDIIMATYLADKVIVFQGIPSVDMTASEPKLFEEGMNTFLRMLGVTFRRDPDNFRPRINKDSSIKDMEQKRAGSYFAEV